MTNLKMLAKGSGPNSKAMKEYKESLEGLTLEQREASIGLVLGDASLQSQNNGKTFRLKFEWGDKNKPYLDLVYNLFNEWVLSEPHKKAPYVLHFWTTLKSCPEGKTFGPKNEPPRKSCG